MCCPNLSVLKTGFRTEEEEALVLSVDELALADGWCILENRSEVARGIRVT